MIIAESTFKGTPICIYEGGLVPRGYLSLDVDSKLGSFCEGVPCSLCPAGATEDCVLEAESILRNEFSEDFPEYFI